MKLAVFSDIHGNIHALRSVLEDINKHDVDMLICAGDLVGYGAFPNEVIQMIRGLKIPVVMGNYDQGVGFGLSQCGCNYQDEKSAELGMQSLLWTQSTVTPENKLYLQGLLEKVTFKTLDKKVTVAHGSPRRVNEYLFADRPEESLARIMEQEGTDLLICGHTHLPYHRRIGERDLINAGSVGKPKDGNPRAGYVLLEIGQDALGVEFIRVEYDKEEAARAVEESGLPVEFAQILREARG